jgi:hypothetical protein
MRRACSLLAVIALSLAVSPARAHRKSMVKVEVTLRDRQVDLVLRGSFEDLDPTLDVAEGVRPIATLYRAKQKTVLDNVGAYLTLEAGRGTLCTARRRALEVDEARGRVVVRLEYRCPRRAEEVSLRYDLLLDRGPGNRAVVTIHEPAGDGQRRTVLLTPTSRELHLRQRVPAGALFGEFLLLGVEHIFTGYDHLIFLLALLLMGGLTIRAREETAPSRAGWLHLLAIVSSFTLAHSVTLALAALDLVTLPSQLVEAGIALTIVFVGVENILRAEARRRWIVTFLFGLVHGFGFAHVLREIGLPQSGFVLSLLGFNLGVELGQLAVVALLYPIIALLSRGRLGLSAGLLNLVLLGLFFGALVLAGVPVSWQPAAAAAALVAFMLGLRRWGYRRAVVQAGSAVIVLFGLFWLIQRALGLSLLGGALG